MGWDMNKKSNSGIVVGFRYELNEKTFHMFVS